MLLLYQIPEEELIGNLKLPPLTGYQRPIVSRIVRTVDEHRGAMLVASTDWEKRLWLHHISAYMRMNGSIISALLLDDIDAWILKAKNEWMINTALMPQVMIDCTMVIVS